MDSIASAQTFYAGEFRHAIDEKNRITIPSRWRRKSAEEFILLPDSQNQFLLVMSPEEFARMSAAAESNASIAARERRIFLRQLHSRAQHGLADRSEEHTSELQSLRHLVCRLLLEKKKTLIDAFPARRLVPAFTSKIECERHGSFTRV